MNGECINAVLVPAYEDDIRDLCARQSEQTREWAVLLNGIIQSRAAGPSGTDAARSTLYASGSLISMLLRQYDNLYETRPQLQVSDANACLRYVVPRPQTTREHYQYVTDGDALNHAPPPTAHGYPNIQLRFISDTLPITLHDVLANPRTLYVVNCPLSYDVVEAIYSDPPSYVNLDYAATLIASLNILSFTAEVDDSTLGDSLLGADGIVRTLQKVYPNAVLDNRDRLAEICAAGTGVEACLQLWLRVMYDLLRLPDVQTLSDAVSKRSRSMDKDQARRFIRERVPEAQVRNTSGPAVRILKASVTAMPAGQLGVAQSGTDAHLLKLYNVRGRGPEGSAPDQTVTVEGLQTVQRVAASSTTLDLPAPVSAVSGEARQQDVGVDLRLANVAPICSSAEVLQPGSFIPLEPRTQYRDLLNPQVSNWTALLSTQLKAVELLLSSGAYDAVAVRDVYGYLERSTVPGAVYSTQQYRSSGNVLTSIAARVQDMVDDIVRSAKMTSPSSSAQAKSVLDMYRDIFVEGGVQGNIVPIQRISQLVAALEQYSASASLTVDRSATVAAAGSYAVEAKGLGAAAAKQAQAAATAKEAAGEEERREGEAAAGRGTEPGSASTAEVKPRKRTRDDEKKKRKEKRLSYYVDKMVQWVAEYVTPDSVPTTDAMRQSILDTMKGMPRDAELRSAFIRVFKNTVPDAEGVDDATIQVPFDMIYGQEE